MWRAAPALRWATLGWAALLAVLQLQQAGVASALGSGLAPPTPEQVAFRASARRAVSERQADENGTGTLGCVRHWGGGGGIWPGEAAK